MKKVLLFVFFIQIVCLFAQEALKSTEEEYYDFLSLQGIVERPTLGYRTLSDSVWEIPENTEHVWQNNNLGSTRVLWQSENQGNNWFTKGFFHGFKYKLFGPDWFNSFNTAVPYGQNDGALWQGRGYNTSLTTGARIEGYGFELTFKPMVTFSQNLGFDIMPSVYDSQYGYIWGYTKNIGIDAPQRFGNTAFWNYDWCDSEIRWKFYNFTAGFGTQSVWIGPSWKNAMLGSNNAPSYPKFDIGLQKTEIIIPGIDWNIGFIDAKIIIGYLSESDYFDNDESNNHNMISSFIFSYAPSFIPGFTVGAAKICLTKWGNDFWKYINPFYNSNDVYGIGEDQKMSIFLDWNIYSVGLELYGEIGVDDYQPDGFIGSLIRYPFDTLMWTAGLKKTFSISKTKSIYGELITEVTFMELPRNKGKQCYYAFNFHHQISQGFTQEGQYIGTFLGNGGNSQIIQLNVYYPKGKISAFIGRNNPDNTYSYNTLINNSITYKANLIIGLNSTYFISKSFFVDIGIVYNKIVNSQYWIKENDEYKTSARIDNFQFSFNLKYQF